MRKAPVILMAVYLLAVAISVIPIFVSDDALSGVLATLLTLPWNVLVSNIVPGDASPAAGSIAIAAGAMINAGLIYGVLRWLLGVVRRRTSSDA